MTPKEILIGVRELLSEPERWSRGDLACDAQGDMVEPNDETATCWCLLGAFIKVAGYENNKNYMIAHKALVFVIISENDSDNFSIVGWNDSPKRKHSEVITKLDAAIEKVA